MKVLGGRLLGARDRDAVESALALDPVGMCMVASRVEAYGLSQRTLGGQLWTAGDPATSLCYSGVNLIPLLGREDHIEQFAERAMVTPRMCSSVVGRAELVLPMWEHLSRQWGTPREIRPEQPLMALSGPPAVAADPRVKPIALADLERYLPAAVEMFLGEIGVDPRGGDGGKSYRRRIAALIAARRVYARFDGDTVVYKAEVGALTRRAGQIQGVWVHPDLRGKGIGAAGTAAVATYLHRQGRVASLYVNGYNTSAVRAYLRTGFARVGTFATVLVD